MVNQGKEGEGGHNQGIGSFLFGVWVLFVPGTGGSRLFLHSGKEKGDGGGYIKKRVA